jgi:hypothetical protein
MPPGRSEIQPVEMGALDQWEHANRQQAGPVGFSSVGICPELQGDVYVRSNFTVVRSYTATATNPRCPTWFSPHVAAQLLKIEQLRPFDVPN